VHGILERRIVDGRTGKRLRFAALLAAGLLAAWTAFACNRIPHDGPADTEGPAWAGVAAVFVAFALVKLVRRLGWLKGWGGSLRRLAKREHVYADRRAFQVVATMVIALIVVGIVVSGLLWSWQAIKPYRIANGFAALAVGYVAIRFVSLHAFDAWNAARPWLPAAVELIAATGASAASIIRLSQLDAIARLWGAG